MVQLLQLRDAYKRYGDQHLLDGASIALGDDEKVGLVGRNGAGKSTLCRILLGDEELDAGEMIRHPRLRLGYLRQHDPFEPGETVHDFLIRDSGKPEWRCGEVAWQFGVDAAALDRPVSELSGGWQTRVKLAALLLHEPNLLLLDEPTNFLDLRTQLMLEAFLKEVRAGCLVVSHDRGFLKSVCSHTIELARGVATRFSGDVDSYLEHRRQLREHDERVNATIEAKRRQLKTFIDKNRGSPRTSSQARSKAKQLGRLHVKELEGPETAVRIRVPEVETRRGSALRTSELAIGYPDHRVAEEIHLDLPYGSRTAVVGDNGQGKTTFLRTVVGSLPALAGSFTWGMHCDVGVYAQHVYTSLPDKSTALEYLQHAAAPQIRAQMILDVAGSFLFRGDQVEKRVSVLSGGERARLCLAGLLLGRHNVLVLDEPGNHLDVETIEALADALCEYQGTIVFTSHDRHFMRRIATGVIEVRDSRVANYPGDYDAYVYRIEKDLADSARPTSKSGAANSPKRSSADDEADRRERNRQDRERKKEAASLERKIARLEEDKSHLQSDLLLTTDAVTAQRLHDKIATLAKQLAPLEARWFELQNDDE